MAHTYAMNLVHCVFSTKNRAELISDEKQSKLCAYTFGICKNIGVELLAIGGMPDHLHLLIALPSDKKLSEIVRDLKANSSRWMNETTAGFSWQQGYAAFSVSPSNAAIVKRYIRNQAEHHKKRKFEEEFLNAVGEIGDQIRPEICSGLVSPLRGSRHPSECPSAHALG